MAATSSEPVGPAQGVPFGGDQIVLDFGPYAAAQADLQAWVAPFDFIVDRVDYFAETKPSVGSNFNIFRGESAEAVATVVTAARDVVLQKDLNTLTNVVAFQPAVQKDNNLILQGQTLVFDFATTTNMAGFIISVTGRMRRAAVDPSIGH